MIQRKDAFFGLHLDLHPVKEDTCLGADISVENIEKLLMRVRPEHIAYDCKGHQGITGYRGKVGAYSPGILKDSLKMWREVTAKHNVLLSIHYSGVIDEEVVIEHPEWKAILGDEESYKKEITSNIGPYINGTTSTFSAYADDYMIPQLKEVIELYDVDGVWLDGECWGAKLDYSPLAFKAWRAETGYDDMPRDLSDSRWLQWKTFHRKQFESYIEKWVDAVHECNDHVCAASNWAYTTMMPKERVARVDFISGDFDPFLSVDRARTEVRYLTNVGMPWELQAWGFDLVDNQDECLKLPEHLKQEASVVLMHGGGFMMYFLPTRSGYINDTIIETAGEVADFCHERKALCFKSQSVPQVAILHSADTMLDVSDRIYAWKDARLNDIEGTLHALLELHYSVDILTEYMFKQRIDEFPLVVIPDAYKLSGEFIKLAIQYVENGGKLLVLGARAASLFKDYLGVTFDGAPEDVNATLACGGKKVSARGIWQNVSLEDAKVLMYRYRAEGTQNRSSYMDIRDEGVSDAHSIKVHKDIAATSRTLGKGKIAAVFGPISELYFMNHHPYMREIIGDVVDQLFTNPIVKVKAPSCVDMSLRRTESGHLSVHLLNLANLPVSKHRAFVDYVPPIGNIKVEVVTEEKPRLVTWEPEGTELECQWKDGILSVNAPALEIHGAIHIES